MENAWVGCPCIFKKVFFEVCEAPQAELEPHKKLVLIIHGYSMDIHGKSDFSEMVCLVWKMFPDPVGVFCALPGPPNCPIVQKSDFSWIRD